jgi:diguanylate cyclase (GGDEF)-like protein
MMRFQCPTIRRILCALGVLVSLIVGLATPIGYWVVGRTYAEEALEAKAELARGRVAKFVYAHRDLWQYQSLRLFELVATPEFAGELVRIGVVDQDGQEVMREDTPLAWPVLKQRVAVEVGGETIGWVEAEASLSTLMMRTGRVAGVSFLLAVFCWFAVRRFPMRVLDETLAALNAQRARFQVALDNMSQGLLLFDGTDRLIVQNRKFVTMFGMIPEDAAGEGGIAQQHLHRLGLEPDMPAGRMRHERAAQEAYTRELADGRLVQVTRQAVDGGGYVTTYEDITERRRSQEQLSHMARHDALTGLPNRVMFREHLERALPRVKRGDSLALLLLDLDGFKAVNDTQGHPAGDELLREVAAVLTRTVREADLVARLGGDEFAVIQAGPGSPEEMVALAERLVAALRVPFDIEGRRIEIGASIGITPATAETISADELLRSADVALYRAKETGRGRWCFFESGMDDEIHARRMLETDLRQAVREEMLVLHYQPLMEARRRTLAGFEALIRWTHPVRGVVPPSVFIPLAEETGLINEIGTWVLRTACVAAMQWPAHVRIAVNLSPLQLLTGRLVEEVERALRDSGLPAARLELEITESVLLQDSEQTLKVLHQLHALGVHISMDDFGTGYSSLSYLRRFPFDKIKIDQSFVRDLTHHAGSIEIVRAVLGLGKALGMRVLAEGVETEEQFDILEFEGCNELQGYLFSRPVPVEKTAELIRLGTAVDAEELAAN